MEEIKEFINERLKNPFLASLAFFWLVFNWRIPVFLFISDFPAEARFNVIKTEYTSFSNSILYPVIAAIAYYYLKDIFFNLLEKDTAESFIKRKETYTDREMNLIDLEIKKTTKLNELADAKARNKEIDELRTNNDELQEEIEILKNNIKDKDKNYDEKTKQVDALLQTINLDFQYDLRDDKVLEFINKYSEKDIENLGNIIYIMYQDLGRLVNEQVSSLMIDKFDSMNAGTYKLSSSGQLIEIELFSIGKYTIRRFLFTRGILKSAQINFTKLLRNSL